MNKELRILIVEDSENDEELLLRALRGGGVVPKYETVCSAGAMQAALDRAAWDIVLCDYAMPQFDALSALEMVRRKDPDLPFIIISGTIGEDAAVGAMRAGARDYFIKGKLDRLVPAIERELLDAEAHRTRRRAEAALITSEAKYRTLFDQASDSILLLEQASDGIPVIRDFNVAALRTHGYAREELLGKPISFLDAEVSISLIKERVRRIANARKGAVLEVRHRRKDGSLLDLEASVAELEESGKRWLLHVSRDITERRQTEAALREARDIVERSPAVAFLWKNMPGWPVEFVSNNVETLFGYTAEEFISGRASYSGRIHPEDLGRVGEEVVRYSAEKGRLKFAHEPYRIITKDGQAKWIEDSTFIRRDVKGVVTHYQGIVMDITARRRAETALGVSEARYRTLYEATRDALMTLFPPDWKFTAGNPATVEMFGAKDEAEFASKGPWDVSPERQPDGELSSVKAKRMIRTALEKGSHFFEWTHRKIGGPDFPAMVLLTRTELDGQTGLLATVRDISAQKLAEAEREKLNMQLLQSQKMEAVGLLAGGVAHDFNNMLTAVMSYAELIRRDLPPGDPKLADVQEIVNAADRAAGLTRQLLAFGRRQIMKPRVVDLNKFVGGMINMLRRLIGEDVQLTPKLVSAPCLALVDPGQIEQVIMNLVINARDAMPKGGDITMETEILPPDEAAHPDMPRGLLVRLSVRDTGCGMSAEVKSRAFEPFFTTKPPGKGTGLGLSTVFGIIKQSGGEIEVESEPGKGSTFSVYLSLAEGVEPDKVKGEAAPAKGRETVLFVDDEDTIRRLGARILASCGYTVLTAANGAEALKVLERHGKRVDLLLTDVVMPGMSGRELAREIARRKLVGRVIYMSGYTDEAIVKHGVLEPGLAFIYKPFAVDAVLRKVREVLDGPADQAKA